MYQPQKRLLPWCYNTSVLAHVSHWLCSFLPRLGTKPQSSLREILLGKFFVFGTVLKEGGGWRPGGVVVVVVSGGVGEGGGG